MKQKIFLVQAQKIISISFLLLLGGTAQASCLQKREALRDISRSLEIKCNSTISAGAREDCAIRKRAFAMFQASDSALCDTNEVEISAPETGATSTETTKISMTRNLWRQFLGYLNGY